MGCLQRILILVLFICGFASAAFFDIDIKDSRLQTENYVYKPSGILGFAAEFGVFNEPENTVDYTLAVGISRFGYSHSDGDVSICDWHANPGGDDTMITGGLGLNFQWNIPWIPF